MTNDKSLSGYETDDIIAELRKRTLSAYTDDILDLLDIDDVIKYCQFSGSLPSKGIDDFDDGEVMDECESRGYTVLDSDKDITFNKLYYLIQTGKPYKEELRKLVQDMTGKVITEEM